MLGRGGGGHERRLAVTIESPSCGERVMKRRVDAVVVVVGLGQVEDDESTHELT